MKRGLVQTLARTGRQDRVLLAGAVAFLALAAVLYVVSPESGSSQENFVVKVVDTIYDNVSPFRTSEPTNEFISEYDFELSAADLNYFMAASSVSVQAGYKTEFASDYRKVKLEHEGKTYDAKMALFGDSINHFAKSKKSFKIKSDKSEFIEGKRRIGFILPLERIFFGTLYAKYLADRVGLFSPEYEIALVRFNGVPQGLYIAEEGWDQYYLEKNNHPGQMILQRTENWMRDHTSEDYGYDFETGVTFELAHVTPFDTEISNMRDIDSEFGSQIMFRAKQLFEAVEENDQSQAENLLDFEQIAKVEAWRAILERTHDFCGDNLRLFYDTTTGKFGFVPRSEGGIDLLKEELGGVDAYLTSCAEIKAPMLKYVLRNDKLRHLRNQIIWKQLGEKEELIAHFQELEEKYKAAFMSDSTIGTRSSKVAFYINTSEKNLEKNIETLERLFDYSACSINVLEFDERLAVEILPEGFAAVKFTEFSIGLDSPAGSKAVVRAFDKKGVLLSDETVEIEGKELLIETQINKNLLQTALDQDMYQERTVFNYEIVLEKQAEVAWVKARAENAVTGKGLKPGEIRLQVIKAGTETGV